MSCFHLLSHIPSLSQMSFFVEGLFEGFIIPCSITISISVTDFLLEFFVEGFSGKLQQLSQNKIEAIKRFLVLNVVIGHLVAAVARHQAGDRHRDDYPSERVQWLDIILGPFLAHFSPSTPPPKRPLTWSTWRPC